MYFRLNIGEKSLGILNFGLRLCKSYEMMLDYRFKFILIMVNELLCGWANIIWIEKVRYVQIPRIG